MKSREPPTYNFALSPSLNRLRIYRRIHAIERGSPSGSLRNRMAYRANLRRMDQRRLFKFNPFRNRHGWPFRRAAS